MTQEEKQLLLKDLCARLPYGVIIQEYNEEYGYADNALNTIGIGYFSILEASIEGTWINHIENVKPYLRPMSSITDEEERELNGLLSEVYDFTFRMDELLELIQMQKEIPFHYIDWLNSHHFDYRGLIPMGLAIEATKDMYAV